MIHIANVKHLIELLKFRFVSTESSEPPDLVKDISSTSFGYLIAFLLPGIFGLYAVSFWIPAVSTLLQPIVTAGATIGPSFIFLLVAVGAGVCVAALRFFIFEKYLYEQHSLPAEIYQDMTADKLTLHKAIVDEHYRYHQFFGGCAVVLPLLYYGWLVNSRTTILQTVIGTIGFISFEILLERSAHDTFIKYVEKCRRLSPDVHHQKKGAAAK